MVKGGEVEVNHTGQNKTCGELDSLSGVVPLDHYEGVGMSIVVRFRIEVPMSEEVCLLTPS